MFFCIIYYKRNEFIQYCSRVLTTFPRSQQHGCLPVRFRFVSRAKLSHVPKRHTLQSPRLSFIRSIVYKMDSFGSDFSSGSSGKMDTGTIMEQVKVQIAVANAQELLQVVTLNLITL